MAKVIHEDAFGHSELVCPFYAAALSNKADISKLPVVGRYFQ